MNWLEEQGRLDEFQHTAARRRLPKEDAQKWLDFMFQHTAARRRLLQHYGCCKPKN